MAAEQAADQTFALTIKGIEKARMRNIGRASPDFAQRAAALQLGSAGGEGTRRLVWAQNVDECPPPSNIVGRPDNEEAMRFARVADKKWLLELTAAAAGSSGGGGKDPWRTAGAADLIAVRFSANHSGLKFMLAFL